MSAATVIVYPRATAGRAVLRYARRETSHRSGREERMRLRRILATLLLLAAFAPQARASMVEALDLAELVRSADQVVVARVIAQESHYDEHGRIVTDVHMQVEHSEKGHDAPGALVVVRRLGGVVNGIGMRVEGEPSFEEGELVLLFGTRRSGHNVLWPVGMSQGAMQVFERDGERWVRSQASNLALVEKGSRGQLRAARAAVTEPRRLEDLLTEIRTHVQRRAQ